MKLCIVFLKGMIPDRRYPVRLHGGHDQYSGEVQVYVNNTWGGFCAGLISFSTAHLLCKTLGFKIMEEVYNINNTSTPLFADFLYCSGYRSRYISNYDIFNCSWFLHTDDSDCLHGNETAGIVCSDGTVSVYGST